MAVTKEQVTELYVATFDRAPDAGGLNFWANTPGHTIEGIAKEFFKAPETQLKYPAGTTDAAFVNTIYQNVFGRDAEPAGLDYWVNVLGNGWSSRDEMILTVIGGAQNEDADVLANKTEVGLYFADELGLGGDGPFSLEDVTANPATVYYAKASIDALDSWPPVPQPEPEQRYDDIFNFTDMEMSSATRLYLEPDPGGSGHRDAYYDDLSGSAYDDIFNISLVEDYSYDILTVSYLEPYSFFGIGDSNGIMLDMESEYLPDAVDFDGVAYQARLIYDFEAPYTGDYYIQPGWNPGSYFTETAVLVTEYAPDNTILGVQQTTVDDNVTVY